MEDVTPSATQSETSLGLSSSETQEKQAQRFQGIVEKDVTITDSQSETGSALSSVETQVQQPQRYQGVLTFFVLICVLNITVYKTVVDKSDTAMKSY